MNIALWSIFGAGAVGGIAAINQFSVGVVEISISGLIAPMLVGGTGAIAIRFFVQRSNRLLHEQLALENSIRQDLELEVKKRTLHLDQEITERKQIQQDNERLMDAIEKSSEGYILFDADDKFIYANQKYKELYPSEIPDLVPGRTFRDIVKRCAYEGIVTSAVGREEEWINKRVAKHHALTSVSEQKISSGRWVRISEFRTDEGGIFGVRTDITDLKEKMRELDFQKYALDEHAIVSIANVKGIITYTNDKFCDISGYSREELLGQNHRMIKSDEHTEEFYADLWGTIANGEIWRGEIKNMTKDGGYYWVHASIVPFMDEYGKPFQYVAIRTDLTERKKAEDALKLSEARYQAVVEDQTEVITRFSPDGIFNFVNEAYCRLVGKKQAELIGTSLFSDVPKNETQPLKEYFNNFDQKLPRQTNKNYIKNAAGELRYFEWTNSASFDEHGEVKEILSVGRDSTERKAAEVALHLSQQLLQKQVVELKYSEERLEAQAIDLVELAENEGALNEQLKYEIDIKNRFFSIISHDLKSPFTSLLGMTKMMSQMADSFSKDKLVEYANSVNEAGERVFELVHNLLDWSRLQMDGEKLEPEIIPLDKLAQESIEILKTTALEKNIALTNKIKKTTAFADKEMVRTVIRNLVANSLKFTPSGGSVEVSSRKHGDLVQVTVTDTGVGMSTDQTEKIFSLDQKTSTTGTAGEKGTGLGLPLCRDMLERNGGDIWVESTPGEGSRFHFTLPIGPSEK
ncbi:MAG: PAS domain-containing sensor histidine kinase [Rhodospirillales bacterium]|nr:PAS domain-containing sensor histidine kinase [Rhodospirillales bacterium]